MRINTAFILCAGFGKRLNPLTLDTPKPLIKLNNIAVLETCINLIESLGVSSVSGFNLFPNPAHKIKAVLILILLCYKFREISF